MIPPLYNNSGLTVAELKRHIEHWPETNERGEPTEVWIETGENLSGPCVAVEVLNRRTLEDGSETSDLLFCSDRAKNSGTPGPESKRMRLMCEECGWRGDDCTVLRAQDPFNSGCDLVACPQCREQAIRTCCDEPGCWDADTCGTSTPRGYRRTCHKHAPPALDKAGDADDLSGL